jgi:hypothetical protein
MTGKRTLGIAAASLLVCLLGAGAALAEGTATAKHRA